MTAATTADLLNGYEVVCVSSLYRRNEAENADREYRVALLRHADGWNVLTEFGRRGARLKPALQFSRPVGERQARSAYVEREMEKRDKGYKDVDLYALEPLYAQLRELGMERFDVDLFLDLRGKVVSVPQYLANNGMTATELCARANAYASACAVAGVVGLLEDLTGQAGSAEQDVNYQLGKRLVEQKLHSTDLPDMGIFLGRRTAKGVLACCDEQPAAAAAPSRSSGTRRRPG